VGAYTLTSTTSSAAAITNCETWYVVPGLDLEQTITRQDCEDPDYGDYRWDEYKIALRAGQTVTITLESTTFDAELWLFDSNFSYVAHDDDGGGGTNARIVFTASVAGVYEFELGPSLTSGGPVTPTGTGAYTLRIR
jgi:hypothetical protein